MCEYILSVSSLMSQMEQDLRRYCKQTSGDGKTMLNITVHVCNRRFQGRTSLKGDTVFTGTQRGTAYPLLMLGRLIIGDLKKNTGINN